MECATGAVLGEGGGEVDILGVVHRTGGKETVISIRAEITQVLRFAQDDNRFLPTFLVCLPDLLHVPLNFVHW
jgi:hypothetical protein